jgi:hypothetical protein
MDEGLQVLEPGEGEEGGVVLENNETREEIAKRLLDVQMRPVSQRSLEEQFRILKNWIVADQEHSNEWRGAAKMWFEFKAGEHWTAEDKALLEDQSRPVITFNRVLTVLKAVAGMEINGRHEISFLPRGVEDTAVNDVLNGANKWMEDETDGEDEESQAFDDCATCGMGWVENRMSYEDEPDGLYVEESVNPLEMGWDRTSRKKNLSDSKRRWRVRRMPVLDAMMMCPGFTREQLDAGWSDFGDLDYPKKSLEQKWKRDENNTLGAFDELDEVSIVDIQWIEKQPYWVVADEETQEKIELNERDYQLLQRRMKALGMELTSVRLVKKAYKRSWLGGEGSVLKPAGPAPISGRFSWECVTGELDKIKGTWFGLVKIMRDPQMWANKWLSQVLHILNSTAKGGVLAELDAFDDQREAEESYAQADQITYVANGALSGQKPKIIAKPGAPTSVDAYMGLLTFAVEAIHQIPGINLELLGQRDINQPGIVEAMRKQAGMTVLATLFDSLRRFRKGVGRSRLFFIQNFLSDNRLIRIVGKDGSPQAVRLAREKTTGTYDVVVDDTPTSPNQKEANWQIIQPMLAVFKEQLMADPEILILILEYSPLPARIVDAIRQLVEARNSDPQAQQQKEEDRKLLVARTVAAINKDQSTAEMQNAKAGSSQATAAYDIAMARNMIEDNLREGRHEEAMRGLDRMKVFLDAHKAKSDATKARADTIATLAGAERDRALADRERMGTAADAARGAAEAQTQRAQAHRERIGAMVDALVGHGQAVRHHATATKELAAARAHDRKPVAEKTSG